MASPVSPAVAILTGLGFGEARAKKQVAKGMINLVSVRRKVTDTSVIALAEHCPGLTAIDLVCCPNITDASIVALAEHCTRLAQIDLYNCYRITDASIEALAKHCLGLKKIDLWWCNITDTTKQLLRDKSVNVISDTF